MKKKLKRYVPLICLVSGWALGIPAFYSTKLFKVDLSSYCIRDVSFSNACSAIWTQLVFFILICLFGFSMLSGIIPVALVSIRSALASFSCALIFESAQVCNVSHIQCATFTVCSALICVFMTSSARLAHIFYTKVPHNKIENTLDYLARQLFTMGFAMAVMIIYFTLSALL